MITVYQLLCLYTSFNLLLTVTAQPTVARFTNESCAAGGVKPTDPLHFTCQLYEAVLLRVILPSGDQEIISVGDTATDVILPPGFTAVSLDITEIDNSRRNFNLTLSIAKASLLNGSEITCDNTTDRKSAKAGCPLGRFNPPSNH